MFVHFLSNGVTLSCNLSPFSLQVSCESPLHQEVKPPQEVHMKQQEQAEVDDDYYEVDQADIIREAASLDDMAKLITVEEVCTSSFFSLWISSSLLFPIC